MGDRRQFRSPIAIGSSRSIAFLSRAIRSLKFAYARLFLGREHIVFLIQARGIVVLYVNQPLDIFRSDFLIVLGILLPDCRGRLSRSAASGNP